METHIGVFHSTCNTARYEFKWTFLVIDKGLFTSFIFEEFRVYLFKELSLEFFKLISTNSTVDIIKAKKWRFGKDILKVSQLFLK